MKILLTEWAARHYNPAPPLYTLRRWAREGEFVPPAELVGKCYYVEEDARRVSPEAAPGAAASLVERIMSPA